MELLLNLAWLLLAIPAYQLWRSSNPASRRRCFTSRQCLLALGCVLVLLFPVISATDDLHAMRAEFEESAVNKRSIRQSAEKGSSPHSRLQSPPALIAGLTSLFLPPEYVAQPFGQDLTAPAAVHLSRAGRAPPAEPLA